MRRDNSSTIPTRHRHRRALVVVAAALVPILALALVAGHLLALPARASRSVSFAAAVAYPVDTVPASAAIGDLNGDGHPDLVTANFTGSNTVSVLLNTTVGSTPTPTPTAGGGGSNSVQVTLALTGGGLSASTTAAPSLSATLTGQDQTLNYLLPITVTDARATGAGWNLTITSTQFSTSGSPVNTLPTTASTVINSGSVCAAGTWWIRRTR